MVVFHDFLQKGGADRIHEVGGKNAADQKVDRVGFTRFLVFHRHVLIVEVVPEIGGVDTPVFDIG